MSQRTDRERRDKVSELRTAALRETQFFKPGGSFADKHPPLVNASGMIGQILLVKYGHHEFPTMAEIARDFRVNDELMRVILLGTRAPSKAFLEAVGYERVVLYRRKESPNV